MPKNGLNNMEKLITKLYDTSSFKRGVEDFKKNRMPNKNVKVFWVKRKITGKEWKEYYSYVPGYCILGKDKEGITVGFAKGYSPGRFELCSDEEEVQMDDYRKAFGIEPRPLEEVAPKEIDASKIF